MDGGSRVRAHLPRTRRRGRRLGWAGAPTHLSARRRPSQSAERPDLRPRRRACGPEIACLLAAAGVPRHGPGRGALAAVGVRRFDALRWGDDCRRHAAVAHCRVRLHALGTGRRHAARVARHGCRAAFARHRCALGCRRSLHDRCGLELSARQRRPHAARRAGRRCRWGAAWGLWGAGGGSVSLLEARPRARRTPATGVTGVRLKGSGGDLLSQGNCPQVPSALAGLTSVFGMGTGVALPP